VPNLPRPPTTHLAATIPTAMHAALVEEALARHVSVSAVVRWAIDAWQARPEATRKRGAA
jgi:hypothetical protein